MVMYFFAIFGCSALRLLVSIFSLKLGAYRTLSLLTVADVRSPISSLILSLASSKESSAFLASIFVLPYSLIASANPSSLLTSSYVSANFSRGLTATTGTIPRQVSRLVHETHRLSFSGSLSGRFFACTLAQNSSSASMSYSINSSSRHTGKVTSSASSAEKIPNSP